MKEKFKPGESKTREGNLDSGVRKGYSEAVTTRSKDEWARDRVRGERGKGQEDAEENGKRVSLRGSGGFNCEQAGDS